MRLLAFVLTALLAWKAFAAASEIRTKGGEFQTAPAFTALPVNPSVIALDSGGNPVSGVQVTFQVETGGGSITGGVQMTDANGIAAVGSWTLGPPGTNTISATSLGLTNSPLTLTAIACGPPVTLEIFAGDGQVGTVSRLVRAPCVIVKDSLGTGVPGTTVTFAVVDGGGVATGLTQLTNGQGIGIVDSWQLGPSAGLNHLESTCAAIAGSRVVFQAVADPETPSLSGPIVNPAAPVAGQLVTLTAITDLQSATYAWNFGDGVVISGPEATVVHTFAAAGFYNVLVQASNLSHNVSGSMQLLVYSPTNLTVEKKSLKIDNPSQRKDSVSISGTLTLPASLTAPPDTVVVRFGTQLHTFDLIRGTAKLDGQSFKLTTKSKKGVLSPDAKYSLKFTGDLSKDLRNAGLTAGASGTASIALQIVISDGSSAGNAIATFSVKGTPKTQVGR